MSPAAKLHLPPSKGWPPARSLGLFLSRSFRALVQLVRARRRFSALTVRQIQALNAHCSGLGLAQGHTQKSADLAWIAYVLPRVARIMPFRSDCLVQALAGQDWLASEGIGSEIVIGVERPDNGPFGAHAWLKSGDCVVTGGKIDRYTEIL